VIGLFARDGTPLFSQVPSPGTDARSPAHHPGVRRLWAVFGATSILIAACTSTATRPKPSTAVCFDAAKVKGLHDEFEHKAGDADLSDGMDMDRVVASLRATREIALELALATAADPVAAGYFEDAAEAYLKAPPIPPHVSLDAMSRSDIGRLQAATDEGSSAMHFGIEALNNSTIPFC
jgi:hypothetical protein